jgi:hypothetical protein
MERRAGWSPFGQRRTALIVQQRVDLVNAIIDELVRQRYELPAYSALENIADVVASSGQSKLIDLVHSRLNDGERAGLDALLDGQVVSQRSPFDRVKQSLAGPLAAYRKR